MKLDKMIRENFQTRRRTNTGCICYHYLFTKCLKQ